ncbi:MAG: YihY/virulence factor BrkB family protein [Deltaproteobacteria bacterium]|nr:YihY/virulence factor BrkB family protein [Deltaproteobacteria bacterium]
MKRFFMLLYESVRAFSYDNCLAMAAAISFYALFSLLPLMFLLFSFIGFILGTETWLLERIIEFVKESLPSLSDSIVEDIKGLIANRTVFGWLGIIMLIWSAEFVILAIRNAMDVIFGETQKMGFIKTRFVVWGVFFIWCSVFLISIGLPVAAEILSRMKMPVWGIDISYYLAKSMTFQYFLPVVIMVIAAAFIFKIMAGKNVRARHAVLGSIIFSVLWEAAKRLFALYLAHFGSFNKMYGSLGAIMMLLVWIYYSAVIFLFSAEFIASLRTAAKM